MDLCWHTGQRVVWISSINSMARPDFLYKSPQKPWRVSKKNVTSSLVTTQLSHLLASLIGKSLGQWLLKQTHSIHVWYGIYSFMYFLLYGKACFGIFQATKTFWCASTFPWKKKNWFQVWKVANHWNARVKRFMKKLGSLPSRTDEILFLHVSPKWNCLTKRAQNSRLWYQHKLWIETLHKFFVAQEFNTTHCHIVRCQRRESGFWEFHTFQSYLVKGRWRGSQKIPLARELETLFGIPTKTYKSFLWLNRASSTKKYWKAAGMTPQFHNGTFGSFGFFLTSTFPPKRTPPAQPSNPSGSTLEIGKKEHGPTKSRNMLMTLFLEQKIGVDPLLTPDSSTGLSKSISKTHNKESTCDEARPSLWDVFNPGSEEG